MEIHPAAIPGEGGGVWRLTPAEAEAPPPLIGVEEQPGAAKDPEEEKSWIVIPDEDPSLALEEDLLIDFGEQRLEILPEEPDTTARLEKEGPAAANEDVRTAGLASAEDRALIPAEDGSVGGNRAEMTWRMTPAEEHQQTVTVAKEPLTMNDAEGEIYPLTAAEEDSVWVSLAEGGLREATLTGQESRILDEKNSMTATPADEELPLPATTPAASPSRTVAPAGEEPATSTHADQDIQPVAHDEEEAVAVTAKEGGTKPTPPEKEAAAVTVDEGGTKPTPPEEEAAAVTTVGAVSPTEDGESTAAASAPVAPTVVPPCQEHSQAATSEPGPEAGSSGEDPAAATADPQPPTRRLKPGTDPTAQLLLVAAEVEEGGAGELVESLVAAGADTEAESTQAGEEGLRPLHLACWGGNAAIVTRLLRLKADPASLARGRQAVHWAAYGGHVGALEALAAAGVSLNSTAADGSTPLHLAAENGNEAAAQWLVERGASVLARRADGATAARLARAAGLRRLQAHLEQRAKAEQLLTAAAAGHAGALRRLLAAGADVNACSHIERTKGWSALHLAAEGGKLEAVEALLEAGASVEAKTPEGLTAVHVAARAGSLPVVQVLLPRLEGSAMDDPGLGLVHAAAEGGEVSVLQYLYSCGCHIDARSTPAGQTALHVAAALGHVETAAWLLEEGVSAEARDAAGLTALDCAWRAGQTAALNVLAFR